VVSRWFEVLVVGGGDGGGEKRKMLVVGIDLGFNLCFFIKILLILFIFLF
jgi:hypothetical protein